MIPKSHLRTWPLMNTPMKFTAWIFLKAYSIRHKEYRSFLQRILSNLNTPRSSSMMHLLFYMLYTLTWFKFSNTLKSYPPQVKISNQCMVMMGGSTFPVIQYGHSSISWLSSQKILLGWSIQPEQMTTDILLNLHNPFMNSHREIIWLSHFHLMNEHSHKSTVANIS